MTMDTCEAQPTHILCRDTAERREEQLKSWLLEVRLERRRLEDRILEGSATHAQDQRAALEVQLQALSDTKVTLQGEVAVLQKSRCGVRTVQVCFACALGSGLRVTRACPFGRADV